MIPLLVLASLLLVGSGAVKIRAAGRAKLGLPMLSLLEVVGGIALVGVAATRPPAVDVGFRYVVGAVALVLVSSIAMGMRLSAGRREQEESEGARLITYVRYLSSSPDPTGSDPESPTE